VRKIERERLLLKIVKSEPDVSLDGLDAHAIVLGASRDLLTHYCKLEKLPFSQIVDSLLKPQDFD
jgi:hypothetical protein